MRGLSLWLFSKLVMLVFLVLTFSTVISFLSLTKEKVEADSAEAMAMQIKDAIQTTSHTNTLSSQAVVPIPKTLPESAPQIKAEKLKSYSVNVNSITQGNDQVVYVAIGWGEDPQTFIAAASFLTSSGVNVDIGGDLLFSSKDYRYFVVEKKSETELCLRACQSSDFDSQTKCMGCLA